MSTGQSFHKLTFTMKFLKRSKVQHFWGLLLPHVLGPSKTSVPCSSSQRFHDTLKYEVPYTLSFFSCQFISNQYWTVKATFKLSLYILIAVSNDRMLDWNIIYTWLYIYLSKYMNICKYDISHICCCICNITHTHTHIYIYIYIYKYARMLYILYIC